MMVMILIVSGIRLRILGIATLRPHDPVLLLHLYVGWAMAVSFLFWFTYGITGGHLRRNFLIKRGDITGILRQLKYYLVTIFRGEKDPFQPSAKEKYNPLQKLAYGTVMFIFVPIQMLTGLSFSHIGIMRKYVLLWDMAGLFGAIHVIGAYFFVLYLIVHFYMATLGPTVFSHIWAMIAGYEEAEETGEGDRMGCRG
jgi:thiosulfate reductase cytochrome b subunit